MKKNYLIALIVFVVLAVWLISGAFSSKNEDHEKKNGHQTTANGNNLFQVRVRDSMAERIQPELVISAKTAPARLVTLRSELDASVVEINAERGSKVETGDLILKLDAQNLPEQLKEAEALLKQRQLEYDGAVDLFKKEFQSQTRVAEALALLEGAKKTLRNIEIELEDTEIRVPFGGILQSRPVEIGDYLKKGDTVAIIIENNPLVIVGDVSERQIEKVTPGMAGKAKFYSGETIEGFVRYVSPRADQRARTFDIELEVPNPDLVHPAGQTAQIILEGDFIQAHKLSPALMSLDDEGVLGVKVVNDEDVVEFYPAEIEKSTQDAVWLSGLPDKIRLITLGQGFTRIGDKVSVALEKNNKTASVEDVIEDQGSEA